MDSDFMSKYNVTKNKYKGFCSRKFLAATLQNSPDSILRIYSYII